MISRRRMVSAGVLGGTCLFLSRETAGTARTSAASLDPATLEKYVTPLPIPPVLPWNRRDREAGVDQYTIGIRQFRQQVLPHGRPATTVWGYGSTRYPATFGFPAATIEAEVGQAVRVRWVNQLLDSHGRYLPHLLPVDPTLHWANPPGGPRHRDTRPPFTSTPGPYRGPVPIVTHLHGGASSEESDGYSEAWYLPDASDIPPGYARVGSFYQEYGAKFTDRFGVSWAPGEAVFQYENRERAATMWFHDHALGVTRLNVYAGLAGFYLLRGGPDDLPPQVLPGPAPRRGDRPGTTYHELPLLIQDRSFHSDGSLSYPAGRADFDKFTGPYIPGSDISPIWNPEFFGNTMLANGRTWPVLQVEPRRYRFRLLNGCNSRFLILKVVANPLARRPAAAALPFWQIGSEGGFLPAPLRLDRLLVAPAERADVVVDFTGLPVGAELYLINEGPDAPYAGGAVGVDFTPADPRTTGQVMKFAVRPLRAPDTSVPPDLLSLPALTPIGPASRTRRLSLNEVNSARLTGVGPRDLMLGTLGQDGKPIPLGWRDPITENPVVGTTEVWEFHNRTKDAHPIHIHEVRFQVVDRQTAGAPPRPPEPWESGFKDTVIVYPGEVTRVRVAFGQRGRYMWHCHMLEHEDNEMMRPYLVSPA